MDNTLNTQTQHPEPQAAVELSVTYKTRIAVPKSIKQMSDDQLRELAKEQGSILFKVLQEILGNELQDLSRQRDEAQAVLTPEQQGRLTGQRNAMLYYSNLPMFAEAELKRRTIINKKPKKSVDNQK